MQIQQERNRNDAIARIAHHQTGWLEVARQGISTAHDGQAALTWPAGRCLSRLSAISRTWFSRGPF